MKTPASTQVTIENAEGADVYIFNVDGRQLLTSNDLTAKQRIDISGLDAGTYFMRILKGEKMKVEKIMVIR